MTETFPSTEPSLYTPFLHALPGNNMLLRPDAPNFTIIAVTPDHEKLTGVKEEELIGKGLFEAYPSNSDDPSDTGERDLRASLVTVLEQKKAHHLPAQRYDIASGDGTFYQKWWRASNHPIFSPAGTVEYILHTSVDITDQVVANQKAEDVRGIEKAYHFFMSAPVIIGLVMGDDYKIEMANESLLEVWDRTDDVIGKPLLTAIPELEAQGFIALLDEVRNTGKPFYANEFPITLNRHGKQEERYFDFVYKAYYHAGVTGKADGVISIGHDVTAQVLAKKKVEESESKYRSLFESMDQGFCIIEMIFDDGNLPVDYCFLETNPVFEKQSGIKNAVGKKMTSLVPNLEAHWFERYGKVALTGEPIRFTEGSEVMDRWFDVFAFRIGGTDSKRVALLFTDITEKRKVETIIKQSESNLRNMVMQSPVAMCILMGPSFVVEVANEKILEIWGKSREEMMGKPVFQSLPEAGALGLEKVMQDVYTTGEPFIANELPVPLPRNEAIETVYINFVYEPLREADGIISGVMAVAIDVTEQIGARKKVEESNKEFQFVTDFMPQMIWITRPDGYHYYYNKQWFDYTGLDYEETKGDGWNHVFHPEDQERAWKTWQHSLDTGEPYEIEYRCRRYDGVYQWFLGRALPLRDESGTITKWFGTCTDIDDQKKAADLMEDKVEERTRELQLVNDQLKQFAYSASHDLQEPLRKIGFFIDRLVSNVGPTLSAENKLITDRIVHTTGRMRTLIDDLLTYSNATLGATGFEYVDLNEVIKGVLDDMEATLIQKGAVVNLDPLPKVKGDQRQLRQLFQNLVSNALKYHKKDEPPQVHITSILVQGEAIEADIPAAFRTSGFYQVEVKDNGIGFDPDDAERIFRLFQRLHGKAEYEGTGVGLAIVQKVIENHKGFIWAEAVPGEGASFKILFPADNH